MKTLIALAGIEVGICLLSLFRPPATQFAETMTIAALLAVAVAIAFCLCRNK